MKVKCKKVRKVLENFQEKRAFLPREKEIEEHILRCRECKKRAEWEKKLALWLKNTPRLHPPSYLLRKITLKLFGEEISPPPRRKEKEKIFSFLAKLIDERLPYPEGHSERVTSLSLLVGKELGLSTEELENLEKAALLHDIGMLKVRDEILLKPAPLTDPEWQEIKEHPRRGAEILRTVDYFKTIVPWVLYHHERYDSTGYPQGLGKDEIPLPAKIIAVADTFDALTSPRPYRRTFSPEEALEEIKKHSGKQFDPWIVEIVERMYGEGRLKL